MPNWSFIEVKYKTLLVREASQRNAIFSSQVKRHFQRGNENNFRNIVFIFYITLGYVKNMVNNFVLNLSLSVFLDQRGVGVIIQN